MEPHVSMGINFRKHFSLHYSKKKALDRIRDEEKRINNDYHDHKIERSKALELLDKLTYTFYKIKGKL